MMDARASQAPMRRRHGRYGQSHAIDPIKAPPGDTTLMADVNRRSYDKPSRLGGGTEYCIMRWVVVDHKNEGWDHEKEGHVGRD